QVARAERKIGAAQAQEHEREQGEPGHDDALHACRSTRYRRGYRKIHTTSTKCQYSAAASVRRGATQRRRRRVPAAKTASQAMPIARCTACSAVMNQYSMKKSSAPGASASAKPGPGNRCSTHSRRHSTAL